MCWAFVGTTIEKVKVSCKLQRIVFNFIITFSTKGVLKWRTFGMYLEIGLHISYISHWNWKETVTYIYWTALFLDHKRPSCMPLTFLIMKISYWIYAANNLGNKCQLNTYTGIEYIRPTLGGWMYCWSFCAPFGRSVLLDISCQRNLELECWGI